MSKVDKQQNVVDMIKTLGAMRDEIKDKNLEKDYARFLHVFITSSVSLVNLMQVVDTKISNAKLSKSTTADGMTNQATSNFWTKVRNVILETYNKNKEK
jgi:hypothetical protein